MAYNNAYVVGQWALFWHAGEMRIITCKVSLAGVELPTSPIMPTCKACPTFHIKGMCNMGCRNVAYHALHTQEQYPPLWGWALQAVPEIKGPAPPIA